MDGAIGPLTPSLAPRVSAPVEVARPAPAPEPAPKPVSEAQLRVERRVSAERQIQHDSATDSMVYRMIDVANGSVLVQTPSEARLRLRAYIDRLTAEPPAAAAFERSA